MAILIDRDHHFDVWVNLYAERESSVDSSLLSCWCWLYIQMSENNKEAVSSFSDRAETPGGSSLYDYAAAEEQDKK